MAVRIGAAGDFVRDITVQLDLEELRKSNLASPEVLAKLRIGDGKLWIPKGTVLRTQHGNAMMHFVIDVAPEYEAVGEPSFVFKKGSKPALRQPAQRDGPHAHPDTITLPAEKVTWGGGAFNLLTAIRTLSPADKTALVLGAINGSWRHLNLEPIVEIQKKPEYSEDDIVKVCEKLNSENLADVIELHLEESKIEFFFQRASEYKLLHNLIVSKASSTHETIRDRIIFKSPYPPLQLSAEHATEFAKSFVKSCDAVMINSLSPVGLFSALVDETIRAGDEKRKVRPILALTKTNLAHLPYLVKKHEKSGDYKLSKFVVIMNESEAEDFVKALVSHHEKEPFLTPDMKEIASDAKGFKLIANDYIDYENVHRFFRLIQKVRGHSRLPVYLTLGEHGSMALDANEFIHFVGACDTPAHYDTTGLGDAWAACITLLESHNVAVDGDRETELMKIAAAVAACKLSDPLGRLTKAAANQFLKRKYVPCHKYKRGIGDLSVKEFSAPPDEARLPYVEALDSILY